MMKYLYIPIISIFSIIFVSYVYGEVVILEAPSKVYFIDEQDKDINLMFQCQNQNDSLNLLGAYVQFSNFQKERAYFNGESFFKVLKIFNIPLNYGIKPLKFICEYNDTINNKLITEEKIIDLEILHVDISITNPTTLHPMKVYSGDFFYDIDLKVTLNEDLVSPSSLNNIQLYIYNDSYTYKLKDIYYYVTDDFTLKIMGKIPATMAEGIYSLKLTVDYLTDDTTYTLTTTQKDSLEIRSPLRLDVLSPNNPLELKDSQDVIISFKFYEKDELSDELDKKNIRVYLDDKEMDIIDFTKTNNVYYVKIHILKPIDIENYKKKKIYLEITNYKSYPHFKFFISEVYYVVRVSGDIMEKNGKIVPAEFYFFGENSDKYVKTDPTGKYEVYLLPGKYNIEIKLPDSIIKYEGVTISENVNDILRVSEIKPSTSFNIVKAIYIELLLPSKSSYLRIYYPDKYVYDEKRLTVFYCDAWDFVLNKCKGDLQDITKEVNINIISNYVEIYNKSGAILIGEKRYVVIEPNLYKNNYFVGDNVNVQGVVRDLKGNGVSNLKIIYKVEGYDIKGETTTGTKGEFEFNFPAPLPIGNTKVTQIKVVIEVDGNNFDYNPAIITINVEKRAKIIVNVDDVIKVETGNKTVVPLIIRNGGDLILTDIEFKLEGLKDEWYTITPALIESLNTDESKEVKLVINIPEDYCKNIPQKRCKEYYFINLRIKSEETREDVSFTLNVVKHQNQTTQITLKQNTEQKSYIIESFKGFTGNVVKEFNTVNKIIIVAFFVIAFIVITIKKRKRGVRRSLRKVNIYKGLR